MNSRGYSLVELMVGVAVMAIIALFGFDALNLVLREQRNYSKATDLNSLRLLARSVLQNPAQCRCNFKYQAAGVAAGFKFKPDIGSEATINVGRLSLFNDKVNCTQGKGDIVVASTNTKEAQQGINVRNIYLGRFVRLGDPFRYRAMLYLQAEPVPQTVPASNLNASFVLAFNVSPAGGGELQIDSCFAGKDDL